MMNAHRLSDDFHTVYWDESDAEYENERAEQRAEWLLYNTPLIGVSS
jgi:hypothetical protein